MDVEKEVAIEQKEVLLWVHELKYLLTEPPVSLVLMRLPTHLRETKVSHVGVSTFSWLRRLWYSQVGVHPQEERRGDLTLG